MNDARTEAPQDMLDRYGEAWNTHDLDAVMSFHTEDTVFHLHAAGDAAVGAKAVREAFAESLRQWPDIHFATEDLQFGPGHITARWTVSANLATPLEVNGETASPTSTPLQFDEVDVLSIRDGRIARKDTYIDAIALQSQISVQQPATA